MLAQSPTKRKTRYAAAARSGERGSYALVPSMRVEYILPPLTTSKRQPQSGIGTLANSGGLGPLYGKKPKRLALGRLGTAGFFYVFDERLPVRCFQSSESKHHVVQ
jgi:hypothetical protein